MFQKLTSIKIGILIALLLLPQTVLALVSPTKEFYVNDYANVLTKETEEHIINQNVALNNKTGAQIVVVTVNSLEGKDIETYANELFRSFGIGDKEKNNGVLLLISTEDRKVRIEVGYGLEETITDGKSGRILDSYMISSLKDNDYDTASYKGFDALYNEVVKYYHLDDMAVDIEEDYSDTETLHMIILIIFIILILILRFRYGIPVFSFYGGSSGGSSGGSFGGFSGGGGSSGGGGASRGF